MGSCPDWILPCSPCLLTQYKKTGNEAHGAKCIEGAGAVLALSICCCSMFTGLVGLVGLFEIVNKIQEDDEKSAAADRWLFLWLVSWLSNYMLSPLQWLLLNFNTSGTALWLADQYSLLASLGLARWQIERREVREVLLQSLNCDAPPAEPPSASSSSAEVEAVAASPVKPSPPAPPAPPPPPRRGCCGVHIMQ